MIFQQQTTRRGVRGHAGGFSLIELLTVIAIIAVLAALLFPVLIAQRAKAQRNACAANLAQIAGGLRMYKLDNGGYPPALFGYVYQQDNGDMGVAGGLYPHWVQSREEFVCPTNPALRRMNARESMFLPTDQGIDPDRDVHLTQPVPAPEMRRGKWTVNGDAEPLHPAGIAFPVGDSYDVSFLPTRGFLQNNGGWERHYRRQWLPMLDLSDPETDLGSLPLLGDTPQERARTYARQLVFQLPDDSTVVTACTYHRDYPREWNHGDPLPADSWDVVLFLDGHTEIRNSQPFNIYQDVQGQTQWAGWQVLPR